MRTLERLLLINWHYIAHELIEFGMVNFLTGKTGMGKSTVVDALQLLFLGDTTGVFFNKAANPNSRRTLRGYLRGEVDDSEEKGLIFLRTGDFSSYIVAELWDTEKKKPFCLGVVFDSYGDGGHDHLFFHFDDYLPDKHFISDSMPMNISKLKAWLLQMYGKGHVEQSNKGFQDVLKAKLGSLNDKFFRLFRKAVPFTPDLDVKGFIADFLVDAEHKVQIEDMRENIRYYKQMEQEAEQVRSRCHVLDSIAERYRAFEEERDRLTSQSYLMARAQEEERKQEIQHLLVKTETAKRDLADIQVEIGQLDLELEKTKEEANRLREERANSDVARKQRELNDKKKRLEERLWNARVAGDSFQRTIGTYIKAWTAGAIETDGLEFTYLAAKGKIDDLRRSMKEITALAAGMQSSLAKEDYGSLEQADVLDWGAKLRTAVDLLREETSAMKEEVLRIKEDTTRLEKEIRGLEAGVKPYEPKLVLLRDTIGDELSARHAREIKPRIFCELMEIKDLRWRDAIEGYLHTQRFYLIIDPEYFLEALRIYDRLKFERGFFDLGLVDVEKVTHLGPRAEQGSLAEEVAALDKYARAYADYLLGKVMKAERVEDLRQYRAAITPTCMLYQQFVARQLSPARYQTPYIGKQAIAIQIRRKKEEIAGMGRHLREKEPILAKLSRLQGMSTPNEEEIRRAFVDRDAFMETPQLKEQIATVDADLGSLNLFYLEDLDRRVKKLDAREKSLNEEQGKRREQTGGLNALIEETAKTQIPAKEEEALGYRRSIVLEFVPEWVATVGEPRFIQEMQARKRPRAVIDAFAAQIERTRNQKTKRWQDLIDQRANYNSLYKGSFDIHVADNSCYESENERLSQTLLPEYEAKIREAKEKAQIQFKEDFISKLRGNIELVERQIDDLNQALIDVPFGRDRYRFRCSASSQYRDFYTMIKDEMLLEGLNLLSTAFQEKHRDTIERLFTQIVTTGEGTLTAEEQAELEKNLEKFTDFRTYLDFDLLVVDEEGNESRLSRVIGKKSGGETQTPFYIAVLASFVQTYRINRTGYDNTFRLIVFDEAYSKMDHQRIQESIQLIKNLGLQVILAAPTEKIGDIAPHVDRNLCVIRIKKQTVVKAFDPRQEEPAETGHSASSEAM